MAPLVSMLVRVARDVAGRSRFAYPTATCTLPAAVAACAAGSLAALGSLPLAARRPQSKATWDTYPKRHLCTHSSHEVDSLAGHQADKIPGGRWEKFVVDDKDLESDEAMWALYHRWCKHFKIERSHEEMTRRFPIFKDTVLYVSDPVNSSHGWRVGLTHFSDMTKAEVTPSRPIATEEEYLYAKALGGYSITAGQDDD